MNNNEIESIHNNFQAGLTLAPGQKKLDPKTKDGGTGRLKNVF